MEWPLTSFHGGFTDVCEIFAMVQKKFHFFFSWMIGVGIKMLPKLPFFVWIWGHPAVVHQLNKTGKSGKNKSRGSFFGRWKDRLPRFMRWKIHVGQISSIIFTFKSHLSGILLTTIKRVYMYISADPSLRGSAPRRVFRAFAWLGTNPMFREASVFVPKFVILRWLRRSTASTLKTLAR